MTELKYLGKKPKYEKCFCYEDMEPDCHHGDMIELEHYRQALLEAAETLERMGNIPLGMIGPETKTMYLDFAKKLRISAGVE